MRWFIVLCAAVLINNAGGQSQNFVWELDSAIIDVTVGPATAVHCQLTSPSGVVVFDDFGSCKVNIERVTVQHSGIWTVSAVGQNNVLPAEDTFHVQITTTSTASKPTVTTSVTQEKPLIHLSCSVATTLPITACVFRDPAGRVLQARQGVSEDRYSFIEGTTIGIQSCGLEINEPLTADLGLWRCDMQTATDIYYGHLTVLCPWAMMDPEVAAAVVSVPTLTSQTRDQVVAEGDSVTMSCSIQSAIRYCYFRARNGTIFSVSPGMPSSSYEYIGAGLDAGECGIRFSSLFATDSGNWSCHVGFPDSSKDEQRVQFSIQVEEKIAVSQITSGREMVIQGIVHGSPALDYCRFVRIDGVGFTSENVPSGYSDDSSLTQGLCKIYVASPNILDEHAWTVAAKVTGQEGELVRKTEWSIQPPSPKNGSKWWLYVFVIPSIVVMVLLLAFVFMRIRREAMDNDTGFQNSMKRQQAPPQEIKPPLPPYYNAA